MIITPGANSTIVNSYTFIPLPAFNIDFELKAKIFNEEGDIKYEYNPFRNLQRADGSLDDFRTDKLNFSLNAPVDITVQPSYDGTVNLILNDDQNPPRLINSRFTVIEDDRYKVIDRFGNNDTNIYRENFVAQTTRLFKTTEKIPVVQFHGLNEGGSLLAGNYVFYFKYVDADGNESDIITESGIISCYVGKINDPYSTRGGLENELTNKIIKLSLENLDRAYDYINVYFTRSTGGYAEEEITKTYKLINKKIILNDVVNLTITGFEDALEISNEEINIQYNIVDKVKTQAQVQNMLFFGNVDRPTIPYKELADLSLRVYPSISNDVNIGFMDHEYHALELDDDLRGYEYYDAVNVYKHTGYWNKEMYRLGIVYVLKDDSLSPVFNTRGLNGIDTLYRLGNFKDDIEQLYTYKPLYDVEGKRLYIEKDEDGFIQNSTKDLENGSGVVRIMHQEETINKDGKIGVYPISINFNIEKDTIDEIKKVAKGFFFVRQKRIPTILAQGISIGVDKLSYVPALKAQVRDLGVIKTDYFTESFLDKSGQLAHDFNSRLLIPGQQGRVTVGGLIVPEAQLRSEFFNDIFTGTLFGLSKSTIVNNATYFSQSPNNDRHFYIKDYRSDGASDSMVNDIKLTLIEDAKPLRNNGTKSFSTRVGIPEEAWRFGFFSEENKTAGATSLIRGAYSSFVGMENYNAETTIVDIHIPGFSLDNLRDYFILRSNSFHPYFTVSDRYDLELISAKITPYTRMTNGVDTYAFSEYRGDCFIGNYTTRIMRNFQDPETPITDIILDPLSWKNNYTGYTANGGLDKEKIAKINRGDVNAVRIGHWATFKLCSNINFAYRAIDESHTAEYELTGKYRSFYPLSAQSVRAESKIPESDVVNVGYNSTTADKRYISLPDVPYIKNIFDSRIMFSEIHVNDAFRNGYRVFQGLAYKDITRQYGAIVKMFEWRGDLLVVFEHGVGKLQINERALAVGENSSVYMKGIGVLPENVLTLSQDYGSSWKDSIIATKHYVYGVDTVAKKIWRTNGDRFEIISDFKIQKYLNDNITLGETEKTPLIALRNVKTHHNAFKDDIMFTFYDTTNDYNEVEWSICFNEQVNKWITRYSWIPLSSDSINNIYFSFDKDSAKKTALIGYSKKSSDSAKGVVIDNVNIGSTASNTVIGTLSMSKDYDYMLKYNQKFSLPNNIEDNNYFNISGNTLRFNGVSEWPKYSFVLKVQVQLSLPSNPTVVLQTFYDYISVKADRTLLNSAQRIAYDTEFSTWFWKHGQAGLLDITTDILPTKWYDKQELFEYEFVVADQPGTHKIFNNLMIISNNAEPDSFTFEVVGDAYDITRSGASSNVEIERSTIIEGGLITTWQKAKDLKIFGRMKGNMHYKEDLWDIEIKPHRFTKLGTVKEARIRDKYLRIRVRYSGEKLAIITALQTLYTTSYA